MKIRRFFDYIFIFSGLLGSSIFLLDMALRIILNLSILRSLLFSIVAFLSAYGVSRLMIEDRELDAKRGNYEK